MSGVGTVLRFGWPYMRRYWRRLSLALLSAVIFGLTHGAFVWTTKTLFERMVPPTAAAAGPSAATVAGWLAQANAQLKLWLDPWLPLIGRPLDWQQILGGLLFLPLPVMVRGISGYLSGYFMGWVSERAIHELRLRTLAKLHSLSLDFFDRSRSGDLLTRLNTDTQALYVCLSNNLVDLVKEPITIIALAVSLIVMDWQLTAVALLFLIGCIVPIRMLGQKARKATHGGRLATASQADLLVEALAGIRIIKAFNLEAEQMRRFRELSWRLVHHGMKNVQARELTHPLVEGIAVLGLSALFVWIFATARSIPNMIGFLTGVLLLYAPMKRLAHINLALQQASVGAQRLQQVFAEEPTVKDPPQPKPLRPFSREIRFDGVWFAYRSQQQPVLQDIHLVIPAGQHLGIAGESGSGKSTLVNLLFRFYDPTAGRVLIDDCDLREVAVADLRQQLALVSQETVLFDATVAENIGLGRPGATRAEIEEAARRAHADDFIRQLPEGYETRIGERGVTLSGGQRQRLAIARAFLRNAPILVLDEATAALDAAAEAEVQAAIDELAAQKTVITVAHRLATLRRCDRIVFLSQGRIIESGTFNELLQANGAFAAMARRQAILPAV